MSWWRTLLSILFVIVVAGVLAIGGLIYVTNPKRFDRIMVRQIHQQTGYYADIKGPITWSWYPTLGIRVPELSVRETPQAKPFLILHQVEIAAAFATLFFPADAWQGSVYMDSIQWMNVRATHAKASLSWHHQRLMIKSIHADFYQGNITGMVMAQNLGWVPAWRWEVRLDNVAVQPLLKDILGQAEIPFMGTSQMQMVGGSQGLTKAIFLHHLEGRCEFRIKQGELVGDELPNLIQRATALHHQPPLKSQNKRTILFDQIKGTAMITSGIATSSDLTLQAQAMNIAGKGSLNLLTQAIDFALTVQPSISLSKQWSVPMTITGTLIKPRVTIDLNALQQSIPADAVNKIKHDVQTKAKKWLQKILTN